MHTHAADIENKLAKALTMHQNGRFAEAEQGYLEILQQKPLHIEALHLLGVLNSQVENYSTGAQLIQEAIKHHPSAPYYYYSNLGECMMNIGRKSEGIALLRKAFELHPHDYATCISLGEFLQKAGSLSETVNYCQKNLELLPDCHELNILLGELMLEIDDLDAALNYFLTAYSAELNFPVFYTRLALGLQQFGKYDEALKCYQAEMKSQGEKWLVSPLRTISNAWLREKCQGLGGKILSIGSGNDFDKESQLYRYYFAKSASYTRLDSDDAIRPDIIGDVQNLSTVLTPETFDIVFCLYTLEHVPDVNAAVLEIYTVLKKGGMFVFGLPLNVNYHAFPNDYHRFTASGINGLFANKFHIEDISQVGEPEDFTLDPRLKLIGQLNSHKAVYGHVGLARKIE